MLRAVRANGTPDIRRRWAKNEDIKQENAKLVNVYSSSLFFVIGGGGGGVVFVTCSVPGKSRLWGHSLHLLLWMSRDEYFG